jgi:uncharacterized protein
MRPGRFTNSAAVLIGCLVSLASCSSPDPVLYTIGVKDGAIVTSAPKNIELRDVGLAGYLDRPQVVLSSDGYRLSVMANDRWGEPLGGMIGRVLSVELAQRLPSSNVYSARSAISVSADAVVEVNIQRMDVGADGALTLLAQAAVKFRNKPQPAARTFTIVKPLDAVTTGTEVAAISAAIGELADGLASMLRQ